MKKSLVAKFCLGIGILVGGGILTVWGLTYHPPQLETEPVDCPANAPTLQPHDQVKVMEWNIQYLAGKGYVFYYDLLDNSGPDTRPSHLSIVTTLHEVARVINDEKPDILLLEEVDDGSARTDQADQLAQIRALLPKEYQCATSAFYWKNIFTPHPKILGSIGTKLAIISKYTISQALRHQLALIPSNWVTQEFGLKRAVLEAHLPVTGAADFVVFDTHLDAFSQGTNTLEEQVGQVQNLLQAADLNKTPWVLGGDFNLLPSGSAYTRLPSSQRAYFRPQTELTPLISRYHSVPSLAEVNGPNYAQWFTQWQNSLKYPDRTIDYIFMSDDMSLQQHYVRQSDTKSISDHFPVVATVQLP